MFNRSRTAVRNTIDRMIHHTHNHYTCFLPGTIGVVIEWLFKLFYSGVRIGPEQMDVLKNLPDDAIRIYTTKYKSYFEYFFYRTRFRDNQMIPPAIGLDYRFIWFQPVSRIFRMLISHLDYFFRHFKRPNPYISGYIEESLINGQAALVSLVEKGGFYRRFVKDKVDPLRYLIAMQKTIDRPIYMVPHLMFFTRTPPRSIPSLTDMIFGNKENPGRLRRLAILFKNPGKVFVEISQPLNLKTFLKRPDIQDLSEEKQALVLRQQLIRQMDRHRQSITGPILKTREEMKENILTGDRLRGFMENYSESRNIPIYKVRKESEEYLEEIASQYSPAMIQIFSGIVRWLITTMFEGYTMNTEMLTKLKQMAQRGPLVLVPCHKSHIDYLILSYVLYHNGLPCPHIAAGKNLAFWPLGPLFRSGGAFFIRRTFRGAKLYAKVFAEYVYKLLQEGFNVEFFIEGGRSRTGKLLQPKLGLLNILLNAYKEGACDDLIFAPVYIGYDRVLEEGSYLYELEGGKKKPENLIQVIHARKFLKKRYGKIYIEFHEPMSLNDLQAELGQQLKEMTPKQHNTFCRELGYRLINAIDRETVVTPHAVVAAAILNGPRKRFTRNDLKAHVETYMNYLYSLERVRLADTLLIDYNHAVNFVFDQYVTRKFIEPLPVNKGLPPDDILYEVNEAKRPALDYYKNNGIIFFIPAAYTAMAILEKDAFQFSVSDIIGGYHFLQDMFNNEFAKDPDKLPEYYLRKNIKAFIDEAYLIPHPTLPDTYNLTSAGFRQLKVFAAFLTTYFESYWIVLNFFQRHPKDFIDSKDRLKKIQSLGNRMFKRREVTRTESLSRINYRNAIDFFSSKGIKGSEDGDKIEHYSTMIRNYLRHLND